MFSFFRRKSPKQIGDDGDSKDKISEFKNEEADRTDEEIRNSINRRDSKTSKEVINLLLPEDGVKYKKDTSYLSGVQSLLDLMGRGKKKNEKKKKPSKTWSFGSKTKRDDNCKSIVVSDDDKNVNYISSNVFANIGDVFEDALEDQNNNEDELEAPRSTALDLKSPPVGEGVTVETVADEEDVKSVTSNCGNCASDRLVEGGRWYFGEDDDQCGAKRDTTRPQQTCCNSDEQKNDNEPPVTCDEDLECYDEVLRIVEDSDLVEQMGTSESRQSGSVECIPGKDVDPVQVGPKLNEDTVSGTVSVCDIDEKNMSQTITTYELVSSSQEDIGAPVVCGSLNLEIMKLKKNSETQDQISLDIKQPRNILKEEKMTATPSSVKKHVTFQNFIEFDDGFRIEDDPADDESFASFDDDDDEDESSTGPFQIEVENDENPASEEGCHGEIVEFEDTSSSEEALPLDKFKKGNVTVHKLGGSVKRDNSLDSIGNSILIEELEVDNDENAGFERESTDSDVSDLCIIEPAPLSPIRKSECDVCNKKEVEVVVDSSTEEEEVEEEEEEVEEEEVEEEGEELIGDGNKATVEVVDEEAVEEFEEESECEYTSSSEVSSSESLKVKKDDVILEIDVKKEEEKVKLLYDSFQETEKEYSAYAELLRILEKEMRGLVTQENRFSELQERAAALHRVQNEVCSARKEAELVRQKLWHVEADLAATRCRNSQLLEQMEAKTEEIRNAEKRVVELTEEAARLQEHLDRLIPENEQLKEKYRILKEEREYDKKSFAETLQKSEEERQTRESWWKTEFERLRSQGAEREDLLLADCEWKLREVQRAAREKTALAEQKLKEVQKEADERAAQAQKQLAEVAELRSLQAEVNQLKQAAREQQRALRMANERASHAAQAETEAARLRTLLDREKHALSSAKAQYTKELEEKENRLLQRLQEQESRLESEWKNRLKNEENEKKIKEHNENCRIHEEKIREAYDRLEILKSQLSKKESQYAENLEKERARADWELLEMRRIIDKTDLKYAETIEKLDEKHAKEVEDLKEELEKKVKELETQLSTQAVSARTTLELVKGQLKSDHAEALQKLREKHKSDMEKQWDIFTADKEQCLERMKVECSLESEEDREKRDKQFVQDIEELKNELAQHESNLGQLRQEARKANEARVAAEKKLSELQVASEAREMAIRSEITRQSEMAQREARETIDHLTKKCACLTNLFEDMRSRWQQAPGEAAQLRKALQDEKAKSAALRRQLDALSRCRGENERSTETVSRTLSSECDDHDEDQTATTSTAVMSKSAAKRRRKKRCTSPPATVEVYLPPVTVPVRIRQFDQKRRKN